MHTAWNRLEIVRKSWEVSGNAVSLSQYIRAAPVDTVVLGLQRVPKCFRTIATMGDIGSMETREQNLVAAPKDYLLGPVFAATKQTGSKDITIGQRRYQVGGFHPMRPDFHPPALDVRHARAIFTLLSFRHPGERTQLIRFSFNEFCRRYAKSNGGRYARAIKSVVADLMDSYEAGSGCC